MRLTQPSIDIKKKATRPIPKSKIMKLIPTTFQ